MTQNKQHDDSQRDTQLRSPVTKLACLHSRRPSNPSLEWRQWVRPRPKPAHKTEALPGPTSANAGVD
ncbi:hypothetical protein BV25DRAFT_484592 [Artomyces pyxidatus]|uniref:Uncharacterized protein n=1 Tax=Artomyces pyxidatus TaxID=48021 RepID=A0ACB8T4K5_9AGAM|nr:hypothetical protein BV25DRAFT_484592 [Artomyces pyxidatus]